MHRLVKASVPVMVTLAPVAAVGQTLVPSLDTLWVRMADGDGILDRHLNHPTSTESAEFSPDETLIASVAKGDDSIRLWRVDDGSEVWSVFADDETEAVTFTRDGNYVVTGGEDFTVRALDVETGVIVKELAHVASIEGMRFSHSGSMLATGNEAGEINIWDTSDPDPANWPDTPLHTVIHGEDQDHPDGAPQGVHADVNQVDWTDDGRFLVSASRNTEVKLWEIARMDQADQGLVRTYRGHHDSIKSVRLSPDETLVAAGAQHSPTGAARVWDVETGDLVAEIVRPNIRIMEAVEFTTDGRYLVIGGTAFPNQETGEFYFYDLEELTAGETPFPAATIRVFNQEYFDFTDDGSKLVSSHADGSLRLWSVATRELGLVKRLKPHPRLLFTSEREAALKAALPADTMLQKILEVIIQYSEAALNEEVVKYEFDEPNNPPNTRRLKAQRRSSMFRVLNLAVAYRMTGDTRFADRAKADLLAAAAFPDWWPPHFLNVGEFSALVALGYDWLHAYLTPAERDSVRSGLMRNGLQAGLEAYQGADFGSWKNSDNNWNQVCNGGLTLAALAVAEDYPAHAEAVVNHAVESIPRAMRSYLPDGAWEEGPTYWAYGTTYNGLMLDGLKSATDSLYGLDEVAGYAEIGRSGLFHVQTVGPTNLYFNFGDAKRIAFYSPILFWMSDHFDTDLYAWYERELVGKDLPRMRSGKLMDIDTLDRFLALLAVWYNPAGENLGYDDLPFDSHFEGSSPIGAFRSGWSDDAVYFAFKGGDNQANHGHMDIGSFVLDAEGVRWASDLGGDDYSLPGYFNFSGPRWQYFRLNNHGHNTLVINDALQLETATADITGFVSSPDFAYAEIDMSAPYRNQALQVRRGVAMLDRARVMIQDEVQPFGGTLDIRWGMITSAEIELGGASALLTQEGKTLRADILEPSEATFEIRSTDPGDSRQDPNTGTSMLAVSMTVGGDNPDGLTILLTPVNDVTANLPVPTFRPLNPTGTASQTESIPSSFALLGNYPNPFSQRTTLRMDLPVAATVDIIVFDMLGRQVLPTVSGRYSAGSNEVILDASALASGAYVLQVRATGGGETWSESGRITIMNR